MGDTLPMIRNSLLDFHRPWFLLLFAGLSLFLHQLLAGSVLLAGKSALSMGLGLCLGVAVGIVLPLVFLCWKAGVDFPSSFELRLPSWKEILLVLGATLSLVPPLETLSIPFAQHFPPNPEYLKMMEWMIPEGILDGSLLILGIAVLVPLGEEILFRGVAFRLLDRRMSLFPAALISGLLFGVIHPLFSAPAVALLGVWFALILGKSRNLTLAVIAHGGWNLANLIALWSWPATESAVFLNSPFALHPLRWILLGLTLFAFFSTLLFREF